MKLFTIGDLHLSKANPKPMDMFGDNWVDHFQKIKEDWQNRVEDHDVVVIPGDISWAMKLEDAKLDLDAIDELPGKKIIIRGNHDYWWQSLNKVKSILPPSIMALQNDFIEFDDFVICGTRGWNVPGSTEFSTDDLKIYNREVARLDLSLSGYTGEKEKIVFFHFPPFSDVICENEMIEVLQKYKVKQAFYGHIHGYGLKFIKQGNIFNIDFHCVSCDGLDFKLYEIKNS